MWLGRYKLGDFLRAAVLASVDTPDAPAVAPVLSIYNSAGLKVYSAPLPPLDPYGATGLFAIALRLGYFTVTGFGSDYWGADYWGGDFWGPPATDENGAYRLALTWRTSAGAFRIKTGHFQVLGSGSAAGNIIAGYFYQRPHANFLVLRTDADARVLARNPFE